MKLFGIVLCQCAAYCLQCRQKLSPKNKENRAEEGSHPSYLTLTYVSNKIAHVLCHDDTSGLAIGTFPCGLRAVLA